MGEYILAIGSALWLGILTSISPCPLATNIAAISYIGRRVDNPRRALLTGLLYTLGRVLAYVIVGALVVWSLTSIPKLSFGLQRYMNIALGPLLILIGLILPGWLNVSFGGGSGLTQRLGQKAEAMGLLGAMLMGIIFALSFCPVSAALFFGSLISIAVRFNSVGIMPAVYGIGTALPVLVFAVLIVYSAKSVGALFNKLTAVEKWARYLTGIIFILIGIYLSLVYIFGIQF